MTWNSTLTRKTPLKPGGATLKRSPFKRSSRRKHKIAGHHDQRMLDACRGEPCYLQVPGLCALDPHDPTVVDCHGNWSDTGKSLGLKAKDKFSVPGCGPCHYWLDFGTTATREEKRAVFFDALARWEPVRERKLIATPAAQTAGKTKPGNRSSGSGRGQSIEVN